MLQRKRAEPLAMPGAITAGSCTGNASLCMAHSGRLLTGRTCLVSKCGFQGVHDLQCMAVLPVHSQQLHAVQLCDINAARG